MERSSSAGALEWRSMGGRSRIPYVPFLPYPLREIFYGVWRLMGAGLGVRLRLVAQVSKAETKMELGHRAWLSYATDGQLDVVV